MDMITKSNIKLEKEGFNNLLPRKEVLRILGKLPKYQVIDYHKDYWQNDNATLVLIFKKTNFSDGLIIGGVSRKLYADEFNYIELEENIVVRLWWD